MRFVYINLSLLIVSCFQLIFSSQKKLVYVIKKLLSQFINSIKIKIFVKVSNKQTG